MILEVSPQERLAYAWALAHCAHARLTVVYDDIIERYRERTAQLSAPECWELLSEVPALQY